MRKALAAGERWITIRAPGYEKGQPVLIRQEPDGAARVIGGAGGKLNHLRLTLSDLSFPEEKYQKASDAATEKAAEKHRSALFARATDAVDTQRKRLVEDGELHQQAGLGEVPLTGERPDQLSVQDLDPVQPATKSLGYSPITASARPIAG